MPHRCLYYLLPAEREDLFVAELWEAGTLGVQSLPQADGRVRIEAWFDPDAVPGFSESWRELGAEADGETVIPDTDWLVRYRELAQPFPVGRGLWIDPREPGDEVLPAPDGRRLLRLPARTAFGIGSHESTRLALELLEDCDLAGRRVLDVGAGTGILSFAALLAGARLAVAFDFDLDAAFCGRENGALNQLAPPWFAGTSAALAESARFDLALVNVVPEQILPEIPGIVRRLSPEGELIFSGILLERGKMVEERLRPLGFAARAERRAGDWIAYRFGRSR